MKKIHLLLFTLLGLLAACTPEENNTGGGDSDGLVHVTGISLDRSAATIMEGESLTLTPSVLPENASNKAVVWSSSSDAVATVSNTGVVTGIKAGSATITATTEDGEKKAACVFTVEAALEPSVTVGADNVSAVSAVLLGKANIGKTVASDLKIGFQYSTSAGILPSNSVMIEAESADADYNYSNVISGLQPGTKYYFRSFVRQNGQDTYGETKNFTTKEIESVLLTKAATEIGATSALLNAKLDLTDVRYEDIDYGFYWGQTEDSQDAFIKGNNIEGNAFSATVAGLPHKTQYWYKAYVKLDSQTFYGDAKTFTTDIVSVESISLDRTEYTFDAIGSRITLKATVLPSDADDKSFEWSSDNEKVAIVDAYGNVTAIDNGTAVITAKTNSGKKMAACYVKVAQKITGLMLSASSLTLYPGEEEIITATTSPENAANQVLTWTSSDESVATVGENGKVIAVGSGEATIKVTATDGSGLSASCSVYCYLPSAIDLGLSVKWADRNIYSISIYDGGSYYAWGETEIKSYYDWSSYKWCNGSFDSLTKYSNNRYYGPEDNMTVLEPDDDVAHVRLGGNWRMPTEEEWTELVENCTWKGASNGIWLTSKINGNSIFLPAAGWRVKDLCTSDDSFGYYWSSSLDTDRPSNAVYVGVSEYGFHVEKGGAYLDGGIRYRGFSVRPVSD